MTESLKSDDNFGYIFWFLLTNKYVTQLTNASIILSFSEHNWQKHLRAQLRRLISSK
jgi:hypothetical protein